MILRRRLDASGHPDTSFGTSRQRRHPNRRRDPHSSGRQDRLTGKERSTAPAMNLPLPAFFRERFFLADTRGNR